MHFVSYVTENVKRHRLYLTWISQQLMFRGDTSDRYRYSPGA